MNDGDILTIDGCFALVQNPNRRWWQVWKPRDILTGELAEFVVSGQFNAMAVCRECGRNALKARISHYATDCIDGGPYLCDECRKGMS